MKCPSCRATVAREGNPRYPFCTERCRLVDLGRWINEEYRVPDEQTSPTEGIKNPDDES